MKAIVSVINDLSTDQRVNKTCLTLFKLGYDVLLVGRKQQKSLPLGRRIYKTKRMNLFFEKGVLFYVEFQFRLFLYLLFNKSEVLIANDLDTLLPSYLVAKMKNKKLVYDTHELFCEVPELIKNSFKRKVWKKVEQFIFPRLKHVMAVNDSIAKIYSDEYNVSITVVRNIPLTIQKPADRKTKAELKLPADKKIIILQGAGINVDRGAEEALQAMQFVNNALLLIIGSGDVIPALMQVANELNLTDKVRFVGKVPFEELREYTAIADIGLTLDKDTNMNYKYSLPNKLFDYIHSNVPVLSSNLIEINNIITHYSIGDIVENLSPKSIADKLNFILDNETLRNDWKKNLLKAAEELSWEKEEEKLIALFKQLETE